MMTYKQVAEFFDRRARGKNFKAFAHNMRITQDGEAFVYNIYTDWDWERKARIYTPMARITPDNTVTFVSEIRETSISDKLAAYKVSGVRVFTNVARFKRHVHQVRAGYWRRSVPYTPGLTVNVTTGQITPAVPDAKIRTDRAKSTPVYEYARKVINVMKVLTMVGGFEPMRSRWESRNALIEAKLPMTEENLSEYAELTYKQCLARGIGIVSHWAWDGERSRCRTKEEMRQVRNQLLADPAYPHLVHALKTTNGCYYEEVPTNP